jgi:formylglycine-generating enzyme required for sulfatase activity
MGKRAAIAGVVCWVLASSCTKDDTAPASNSGAGGTTGGSSGNAGRGGKGGGGTSGGNGGSAGAEGGTAGTTSGEAGEGGDDASGGTSGNGGGGKGGSGGKGGNAGNGATSGSGGSDTSAGEGGGGSSAGTAGAGGAEGTVEITPEDGGTITVGGTTVTVPAGAVAEPVTITVRAVDLRDLPLLPSGIRSVGPTVELLPHGTSFSQPISITLAHSAPLGDTVSVMRLDDDADMTWESVPGVTSDPTTATFQTQTFCALAPTAEFGSCHDLEPICGSNGDEDCCQSLLVTGQTYTQGPGPSDLYPFSSTVAPFRLDRFEVTVGRMRHFVESYDEWRGAGYPPVGAGENINVPESGWQASFSNSLPADAAALVDSLKCDDTFETWRDVPGDETLPINCANWYVSFAFCAWDNGRLPTESEWEAAASGGINELVYPWGSTVPTDVQDGQVEFGVYSCMADGSAPGDCAGTDIRPVGSKPSGMGLFGHHDLSGNLTEWALDFFSGYPTTPQTNYANLTPAFTRSYRGGAFNFGVEQLRATYRASAPADLESAYVGVRCARNVAP